MKFLYESIPFALGCLAGHGIAALFTAPREYFVGIASILISIFCMVGWTSHQKSRRHYHP